MVFRSLPRWSGRAPTSDLTNGPVSWVPVIGHLGPIAYPTGRSLVSVHFASDASNPLVGAAPAINLDVRFEVDPSSRQVRLTGEHDGFPAYEAYATWDGGAGVSIYGYDPRISGEGISALFPPMDKTISTPWVRI